MDKKQDERMAEAILLFLEDNKFKVNLKEAAAMVRMAQWVRELPERLHAPKKETEGLSGDKPKRSVRRSGKQPVSKRSQNSDNK